MKKSELKKKSRAELVRMANARGVDHTGTDEQLIERLTAVEEVAEAPTPTESGDVTS